MPNAMTHAPVGVISGGVVAYAMSPMEADGLDRLVETLGGLLGGYLGARLPDIIDPPTDPNHRDIAHGVLDAYAIGKAYVHRLPEWQADFRREARRSQALANDEQDGVRRFLLVVQSLLCLAIAGALAGLIAGYGSHLVLDFNTPKGLPLICRGC